VLCFNCRILFELSCSFSLLLHNYTDWYDLIPKLLVLAFAGWSFIVFSVKNIIIHQLLLFQYTYLIYMRQLDSNLFENGHYHLDNNSYWIVKNIYFAYEVVFLFIDCLIFWLFLMFKIQYNSESHPLPFSKGCIIIFIIF